MSEATVEDLARLRAIAEEGRVQPLLGGWHMILWGMLVIAALLVQWAIMTQVLPLPPMAIAVCWFGAMLLGAAMSKLPALRSGGKASAADLGNRMQRAVWSMGGTFLWVLGVGLFALALYHLQVQQDGRFFLLFAMMPPASFGVYAIALRATAEAAGMSALKPYAAMSLVSAAVTVLLAGSLWQFPAAAAGIFLVAVIPGRIMLAQGAGGRHG